jgi:hypothetical protein
MSPAVIGYWKSEADKLVLELAWPTVQQFNRYPELAINVLVLSIFSRCVDISPPGKFAVPPDDLLQVLWDWVYCGQPLDGAAAIEPASLWNRTVAMTQIRKRGRPITSRHTAVKALFRREYLRRQWADVTRLLCQCGEPHDNEQKLNKCQDNIESQVRSLRKLLRKHGVVFPPKPTKEDLSERRKPEPSQSKANGRDVLALAESSVTRRMTSDFAIQHPAIAILLSGSPMPTLKSDSGPGYVCDAWCLFNPWDRGWVPMWFPTLIGAEAPASKEEYQRLRYNCFDKVFKCFAGSDWPPRGSSESQREAVARTLLEMYLAVTDEQWLEIDDLKPQKS